MIWNKHSLLFWRLSDLKEKLQTSSQVVDTMILSRISIRFKWFQLSPHNLIVFSLIYKLCRAKEAWNISVSNGLNNEDQVHSQVDFYVLTFQVWNTILSKIFLQDSIDKVLKHLYSISLIWFILEHVYSKHQNIILT